MSWEDQYRDALKYPYQLVPGESCPAEGEEDGDNNNDDDDSDDPDDSSFSGGAIAGIVVGAVAGIAILGALFHKLMHFSWRWNVNPQAALTKPRGVA